jgi:hypothetical protein
MRKLWKYSGIFLIATGILHTAVALAMGKESFVKIAQNGFFNTVADNDIESGLSFWFLVCGIIILLFGQVLHFYIKKLQQPAPKSFGYSLLIFSIVGCCIVPFSGFWLFLPQALLIIFANIKKEKG